MMGCGRLCNSYLGMVMNGGFFFFFFGKENGGC